MGYEKTVKLGHDEKLAKVSQETGEIQEVPDKKNNIPADKQVFKPDKFAKVYFKSWELMQTLLSGDEIKVVMNMVLKAKMNTNSLAPLSDEMPKKEIAKELGISRNRVTTIIEKLRKLGVFANYEVTNQWGQIERGWILNPHIAFSGKIVSNEIVHLFSNTVISKQFSE